MFPFIFLLVFANLIIDCRSQETDETSDYLPLRLIGGESDKDGRVEVYYDGSWATICDDGWDIKDAEVACHQLGFSHAVNATVRASFFGPGEGDILYENSNCNGDEEFLSDCLHSAYGDHDCSHGEDAGVVCGDSNLDETSQDSVQSSFSSVFVEASSFFLSLSFSEYFPSTPMPTSDEVDTDCVEDKCENGATCEQDLNYELRYICVCASGWTGIYCQLTVLDNGTEEEEEFDIVTGTEKALSTDSIEEITQFKNYSVTINSTTVARNDTMSVARNDMTSPIGIPSTTVTTTSLFEEDESSQTIVTMLETSDEDNVTIKNEVETTSSVNSVSFVAQYSTTTVAPTTEIQKQTVKSTKGVITYSEYENNYVSGTTTSEPANLETVTKYSLTSEVDKLLTTVSMSDTGSTTSTDVIEFEEFSSKPHTSTVHHSVSPTDRKATKPTTVGIHKALTTDSFPILIGGSASSSQSSSTFDFQTFVLIGLGMMIIILLILIAVALLKKQRNEDKSPIAVVEDGRTTGGSLKSTEYTNVAFDGCLTQTNTNGSYASRENITIKEHVPSISSSLETSLIGSSTSQSSKQNQSVEFLKPQIVGRSERTQTTPPSVLLKTDHSKQDKNVMSSSHLQSVNQSTEEKNISSALYSESTYQSLISTISSELEETTKPLTSQTLPQPNVTTDIKTVTSTSKPQLTPQPESTVATPTKEPDQLERQTSLDDNVL